MGSCFNGKYFFTKLKINPVDLNPYHKKKKVEKIHLSNVNRNNPIYS